MRRPLPLPTAAVVFPPHPAYPFLQSWSGHCFDAQAPAFCPKNTWWLAELALLAYLEPSGAAQAWDRAGLAAAGWALESAAGGATLALLVKGPGVAVVAFRGTQVPRGGVTWEAALANLATDADLALERWPAGGRVHRGFARALDELWLRGPQVASWLEAAAAEGRRVWFTGHSLGAALATLAAHRWRPSPSPDVGAVYTFGSPRVGDTDFAASMPHATYRLVNNNDVVPHVPPWPYQHVGRFHYFDAEGRMVESPDGWRLLKEGAQGRLQRTRDWLGASAQGAWLVPGNSLVDHSPLYYALLAWNHYADTA